jgi:orotate phosphoribosyltransferase
MARFNTWYMDDAVFRLDEVIDRAIEALEGADFDTIVGTGFSGGIVIPSLALRLGKKFVLIRKETDDSHHGTGRLLGELGERWIFVDDFVSSGRTRRRVIQKIMDAAEETSQHTVMVGQYMYVNYSDEGPQLEGFSSNWIDDSW